MSFNPTEQEVDDFNNSRWLTSKDLNKSMPPPVFIKAQDPNVNTVVKAYLDRAKEGMEKYKVTTERKDIDLLGWLNHLQEELMDATIYLERAKQDLK